jgi:hypothetical protein
MLKRFEASFFETRIVANKNLDEYPLDGHL